MFHPIYVEPECDEVQTAIEYVKRATDAEYIITTRIDNDDMIHKDYIHTIQQSFSSQYTNTFLCYRFGYQYDVRKGVLLKLADDFNHFESRVEERNYIQTVWVKDDRHDLVSQYGDVKIISPNTVQNKSYPGMWIEVVHECNVVNNVGKWKPMKVHCLDYSPQLKINRFWQFVYQMEHSFRTRIISK